MDASIRVDRLGKRFRRRHADHPFTLQEVFQRGLGRTRTTDFFWGLHDVSFAVEAGKTVGVIGLNGAGKSTLLRLVGGVGRPDKGTVEVRGRIGCLLDLGSGFHLDLSGRENVLVNGVISGLSRHEVRERFDSIVDFSELAQFIDNPLRTYSSGMRMRLAFAVASHINPEILLIDEVLSVGDVAFQTKCMDRIEEFKSSGCATLLVSHELAAIQDLCDEVLLLDQGRLLVSGAAEAIIEQYSSLVLEARVSPS